MRFADPEILLYLLAIPLVVFFYWFAFRKKRAAELRFISSGLIGRLIPAEYMKRQKIKAALVTMALLLMVLALAQPMWGYHWGEVRRRGLDLIIAVDTSKSMLAEDVKPNRLERAKREIEDLIGILGGDRVGIIAFAGRAFVKCPLTLDYAACRMVVDDITPTTIPRGGTDIGNAIEKAVRSFGTKTKREKALIIISDGESTAGEALAAAEKAKERGVTIYCIGIGTSEGDLIPMRDEKGKLAYLKDRDEKAIKSKLDSEELSRIALITGGAYIHSRTTLDLEELYKTRIMSREAKEAMGGRKKVFENRFQFPLAVALILLCIEAVMGPGTRKQKREI